MFADPSVEYTKLTQLLEKEMVNKGEVYTEIMKKEGNVLNTINRVVDHESKKYYDAKLFYHMPLLTILAVFINTWKNIFLELATMDKLDFYGVIEVFNKKDRIIFVGFMLFLIALFLYLVDIAD